MPKLNVLAMKRLTKPGRYGDGGNLWLQVRDAEHRSWLVRYRFDGRERAMGIGPVELVSLAEAREAALAARKLVLRGVDPIAAKRAEKAARKVEQAAALTFRDVATRYIAAHEGSWRNAVHRAQWTSTLTRYVYPAFGDRPVASVQTGSVMAVLDGLWQGKPETAGRLRGRIESVLDYATARNWRTGENPARWRGHLENLLPKRSKVARVEHHPALPWREIGDFMAQLRAIDTISARALELTVLTAARTGETIGARWSEIDLAAKTWTVPASRMKAGVEHRVPLSDRVIDILAEMQPFRATDASFVFPGRKTGTNLSPMALAMALRRLGHAEITVHGFRSSFRDWISDSTGYTSEVAEAALAHAVKNRVEAAYRRGDAFERRRRLMEDWAAFCSQPSRADGAVVALRAAG